MVQPADGGDKKRQAHSWSSDNYDVEFRDSVISSLPPSEAVKREQVIIYDP